MILTLHQDRQRDQPDPWLPALTGEHRARIESAAAARSARTTAAYAAQCRQLEPLPAHRRLLPRLAGRAGRQRLRDQGRERHPVGAFHRDRCLPDPTKHEGLTRTIAGISRQQAGRITRQAGTLTSDALATIRATVRQPRPWQDGRRHESREHAETRGSRDIALCSVLGDALLRRSEAASLTWADIQTDADGSGRLTVRRSKTDQEGEGAVLYLSP